MIRRSLLLCLVALCAALPAGARPLTAADFTPIPVGRDPAALRTHVTMKRWAEAVDTVTGRSPEAAFVRGWLLAQANRHAAAVEALTPVPAALPLLADLARLTAAQAMLTLGQPAEAARLAEPVAAKTGADARFARRIVARGLRDAGRLDQARTVYTLILTSDVPSEVPVALLGLARLEVSAGRIDTALEHLLRVDLEYPAHWVGPKARELAESLVAADPARRAKWASRSLEAQVSRGERLSDAGWHNTVLSEVAPLSKAALNNSQRCRQRYAVGLAQRRKRQFKQALVTIDEAVQACEAAKHEKAPWARHLAGKLHERLGKEASAAAHYRAQIKGHADHRLADDAGFFLVRHLIEDKNDLKGAHETVARLAKQFPAGDMLPEAVFWVFVAAFKAKDYARAAKILALNDRLTPSGEFRHRDSGRVSYWQGRLDDVAGRTAKATEHYRRTMAEAPLSWYAVLAYSRLVERDRAGARRHAKALLAATTGKPGFEANAPVWQLAAPEGPASAPFERARLLARLGLPEPALEAMADAGGGDTPAANWLSAVLMDRAGAYHLSHDIMRRKLSEFRWLAPKGAGAEQWQVAFPRPFAALVQAASKETDVHRHFIWGVMREESGFNPGVESHAAAVGLLQLILPTAKQMRSAKKKEPAVTKRSLTKPKVNIPLGARYLAHVKRYTRAQWALVPAGYNAGAGALSKWLKRNGHLPLDLFVELIPYEEARWYTKRVVSSWAVYRALYGEGFKNPIPYISQKTRGG